MTRQPTREICVKCNGLTQVDLGSFVDLKGHGEGLVFLCDDCNPNRVPTKGGSALPAERADDEFDFTDGTIGVTDRDGFIRIPSLGEIVTVALIVAAVIIWGAFSYTEAGQ